jgi:hypothetical protein
MKKILITIFAIITSVNLLHAKEYKLDENKRLEVRISATEQNRIKIVGDRIVEVVGMNRDYFLESEERQGQIFIKPKEGAGELSFTVISEGGMSQDIKVKPTEKMGGQIIIIKGAENKSSSKLIGVKHVRQEDIANILKDYSKRGVDTKVEWQVQGDLKIRRVLSEKIGIYEIEIWELQNTLERRSIKLNERQFQTESNIAAIMLEELEIDPKDSTKLYKVKYHG